MDHHQRHQQTTTAPRSRASLIVLIALAFLLMIAAVILVISLPDDEAWQLPSDSATEAVAAEAGFACEVTEAWQMYPFGGGVMKLNRNRISFLDIQGTEQFAIDIDFAAPFCIAGSQLFLAADRDGHSYVMLDSRGEKYRGTLPGRISGASISSAGYMAIVQDQSDSTGVVTLFAPETGAKIFDRYFPESGYVMSTSFPEGTDCFDVALVNTAASAARPIIKRYSLTGEQLGQRWPDLTELYPMIKYDPAKNLVLCGASNLAALSYDQDKTIWERKFQQVLAVASTPECLLVLATDRQDGRCNLHLLQADGKDKGSLAIGDEVTNLDQLGDLAAMGSGTRVIVADSRSGAIILDRDVEAQVIRVMFADAGSLTVVTRTGIRRIGLSPS